jgi:phospholipid/cholesterol/gamma-HCH transport system substrate-binding protein
VLFRSRRLVIDNTRQVAVATLAIRRNVAIYTDASAAIKTTGLIGDKYVRVDPGGAGEPLKPGGWITNTVAPPDIEDLLGRYIFGQASEPSGEQTGNTRREQQ